MDRYRLLERNPMPARMTGRAEDYQWSSAIAHVTGGDASGILDMEWWSRKGRRGWQEWLNRPEVQRNPEMPDDHSLNNLRACTYAEHPAEMNSSSKEWGHILDATGAADGRRDGPV